MSTIKRIFWVLFLFVLESKKVGLIRGQLLWKSLNSEKLPCNFPDYFLLIMCVLAAFIALTMLAKIPSYIVQTGLGTYNLHVNAIMVLFGLGFPFVVLKKNNTPVLFNSVFQQLD